MLDGKLGGIVIKAGCFEKMNEARREYIILKEHENSQWRLSVFALTAMLGTFIGIFVMQGDLNLTFAIWYLAVVALIVAANAAYVFYKKKKNNGAEN